MEIRRFGVGNRRKIAPPGSVGIEGQVIHSDARAVISELALRPGGRIEPHSSPNTAWFCVIEGGGFVRVGDEERRVAAGEAVLWPAGLTHGAWTTHSAMRAFVVELAGPDDSHLRGILEGMAKRVGPGEAGGVPRGEGSLAPRAKSAADADPEAGEPA
jgi:quercetin dioxygenase-like cupin family protein